MGGRWEVGGRQVGGRWLARLTRRLASMTARYPAMLVWEESVSKVCPRDSMRGMQSSANTVAPCCSNCVSSAALLDGLICEISVRSPTSLASPLDGGLILITMSDFHASADETIVAPTSSYWSSENSAAAPAPFSTTTLKFALTRRATLSGDCATRFSSGLFSFVMPTVRSS